MFVPPGGSIVAVGNPNKVRKPETDPDKRPQMMDDLKPEHNGEFYDGDSDQDGEEENDA